MLRLVSALPLAFGLTLLDAGVAAARDVPAEITVVSVLTMAKEEAEKGRDEAFRATLRGKVALSMRITGQAAAFGSYVRDAWIATLERETREAQQDEAKVFNLEFLAKAKQTFLDGDVEQAKEILRQCRTSAWPPPRCAVGEWPPPSPSFHDILFIGWEIEEGRFDAAFHRLKATEWFPDLQAVVMVGVGPYVVAGDRDKLLELRRLAEAAGGRFDSCILIPPPSRFGTVPDSLESAAALRKLACDGEARAALDIALSRTDLVLRVGALLIVAEGLAGIPGVSFERLTY
jgi:hypothetical protein